MNDVDVNTETGEPKIKWAKKYDRCVQCGRDDIKHIDRGLCSICFRAKEVRIGPQEYGKSITAKYLTEEYYKNKRSMEDLQNSYDFTLNRGSAAMAQEKGRMIKTESTIAVNRRK